MIYFLPAIIHFDPISVSALCSFTFGCSLLAISLNNKGGNYMEKQSSLMSGVEAASNVFTSVGSSLLAGAICF